MIKKRCVIYVKDVLRITGCSERYGQALMNKIRIYHNKSKQQFITVKEFSEFSGIPAEDVEQYLD